MDMVVSTDWLAANLGADDLVVLDCTVHLRMAPMGSRPSAAALTGRTDTFPVPGSPT